MLSASPPAGGVAFLNTDRGLSTFATNLLINCAAIAAATDCMSSDRPLGSLRRTGSRRTLLPYGTAHVVLGSGLTIAGATFCLSLPTTAVLSDPRCAVGDGMVIVVAASPWARNRRDEPVRLLHEAQADGAGAGLAPGRGRL